jgi:hypothetical protein
MTILQLSHPVITGSHQSATVTRVCPDGIVSRVYSWGQLGYVYTFSFIVDGIEIYALARSPEHLSEICDVVIRLLAASVVHSVILSKWNSIDDGAGIDPPTLAHLMERCQSLKVLKLQGLECLDENNCRVLGIFSRLGLEIELKYCNLTSAGTSALAEVLGRNQGPTKLDECGIDNFVLADGLRGNSRLKSLRPLISNSPEVGRQEVLAIVGALREKKGLVDLNLAFCCEISDKTWATICDSLKTHPTLQVLDLRETIAPLVVKFRVQSLLDMMKVNMSIHRIHLRARSLQHELFQTSVIPYLQTNKLRGRVRAIQRALLITYRVKVLGRALLSARTDANKFWMILSGNAEVAFPSATATTVLVTNLPTPATAAAPVNVATAAAYPVATGPPFVNVAAPASG